MTIAVRPLPVVLVSLLGCGGGGTGNGGSPTSDSSFGVVTITQSVGSISAGPQEIVAAFYQGTSCTSQTIGQCTILRCPIQPLGAANPIGPTVSAGTVTLSGGSPPPITLATRGMDGTYGTGLPFTYAAGDVLTVAASGDVVPAFSTTVTFPPPPVQVQISGAPTYTWTAYHSGSILIDATSSVLAGSGGATSSYNIDMKCVFDASSGGGTVATLADPVATRGGLSIYTANVVHLKAGDFPVTVIAEQLILTEF
jgi:hypothetical protein